MENPEGNNAAVRSLCCELRNESPKLPYAVGLLLTNNGNGAESLLGTLINVDPKVRYALGVLLTNGGTDLFGLSSNSRPTSVIETLLGTGPNCSSLQNSTSSQIATDASAIVPADDSSSSGDSKSKKRRASVGSSIGCSDEEESKDAASVGTVLKAQLPKRHKPGMKHNMDMPFVIEIPSSSWNDIPMSVRDSMVDEGPFGSTRLCHMKEIIMVYQVMSGTMLTVAKTLDVPHGHYDARGEMPSTSVPVKKLFVSLSDSLQSWNLLGADTSVQCSLVDDFDLNVWDFVNEILTEKKKRRTTTGKRQRIFLDYGYCGGQCYERTQSDDDTCSIAVPSLLEGTKTGKIRELFTTISGILSKHAAFLWEDMPSERKKKFCEKIAIDNKVEFLCLACTDISNEQCTHGTCEFHVDKKNDKVLGEVAIFSTVYESTKRLSLICCTRKSVGDALKKLDGDYGKAIRFVMDHYRKMPRTRTSVEALMKSLATVNKLGNYKGYWYKNVRCHMDASIFVSGIVHFSLLLQKKFILDYVEMMSIVRAFAGAPYTSYFLCTVLIDLLSGDKLEHRGLNFGYELYLSLSKAIARHHQARNEAKYSRAGYLSIPGLRFPNYRGIIVPSYDDYCNEMIALVYHGIGSYQMSKRPGAKLQPLKYYKQLLHGVRKLLMNCGALISNHCINIMAFLSLVPSWYALEYEGGQSSRGIQYMRKKYDLGGGEAAFQSFLDCLVASISMESNESCCKRVAENVICKITRTESNSDGRFSDLIWKDQKLFYSTKEGVVVVSEDGQSSEAAQQLISKWTWNYGAVTGEALYDHCAIRISQGLSNFRIPKELGWRKD